MSDLQPTDERQILLVGLVCVDIITLVDSFPEEDTDRRCADCFWQRGGNASTTANVLSIMGTPSAFMGTLAHSQLELPFIQSDFAQYGTDISACIEKDGVSCPISIVISNRQNGSRTILHTNKNMPEVSLEEFQGLNLLKYHWIHLEGRGKPDIMRGMIEHVNKFNETADSHNQITLSLEAEKPYQLWLADFFPLVDYVILSKDFAVSCGYPDMVAAVSNIFDKWKPRVAVFCGWGEIGAAAASVSGVVTSPAFVPDQIVDTLGAGDTFIAALLHSLIRGSTLQDAVSFGCKVAGTKCSMQGIAGLIKVFGKQTLSC